MILSSFLGQLNGERAVFQHIILRKLNIHKQKNKVGLLPDIICKINSKGIKVLNAIVNTKHLENMWKESVTILNLA